MRRRPSSMLAAVHATAKELYRASMMSPRATHELTRLVETTVQEHVQADPRFRDALLASDVDNGKAILRDLGIVERASK